MALVPHDNVVPYTTQQVQQAVQEVAGLAMNGPVEMTLRYRETVNGRVRWTQVHGLITLSRTPVNNYLVWNPIDSDLAPMLWPDGDAQYGDLQFRMADATLTAQAEANASLRLARSAMEGERCAHYAAYQVAINDVSRQRGEILDQQQRVRQEQQHVEEVTANFRARALNLEEELRQRNVAQDARDDELDHIAQQLAVREAAQQMHWSEMQAKHGDDANALAQQQAINDQNIRNNVAERAEIDQVRRELAEARAQITRDAAIVEEQVRVERDRIALQRQQMDQLVLNQSLPVDDVRQRLNVLRGKLPNAPRTPPQHPGPLFNAALPPPQPPTPTLGYRPFKSPAFQPTPGMYKIDDPRTWEFATPFHLQVHLQNVRNAMKIPVNVYNDQVAAALKALEDFLTTLIPVDQWQKMPTFCDHALRLYINLNEAVLIHLRNVDKAKARTWASDTLKERAIQHERTITDSADLLADDAKNRKRGNFAKRQGNEKGGSGKDKQSQRQ